MTMKNFRYGRLGQIQSHPSPSSTNHPPLISDNDSKESHSTAGAIKTDLATQRWWTIGEAAGYLSVSVAFLRKRVRQRDIPFKRVGSKALRFRQQDLDAWLDANNSNGGEVSHDDSCR